MNFIQIARAAGATALIFSAGTLAAGAAPSSADARFVMQAARGGLAEVSMGQLALSKRTSPRVRMIAQRMVTDHSAANAKLAGIAQSEGMSVPSMPGRMDMMAMRRLQTLRGAAFDSAYLSGQVTAHQQTIALFQAEIANGTDRRIVRFARTTLPTVQQHLMMIQSRGMM
jgi:putative membrane protein